jgi:DMSO/TMAO reductase YedYZ molybdopterin-dependent catalytic subunit
MSQTKFNLNLYCKSGQEIGMPGRKKFIPSACFIAILVLLSSISSCKKTASEGIPVSEPQYEVSALPTIQWVTKENIGGYRLTIDGLVNTPLNLTYESLLQYPTVTERVLLVCPDVFEDTREWTGVPMTVLLEEAGLKPEASLIRFYALDGYEQELSLIQIQNNSVFLAYKVEGQTLSQDDGYPLRVVANSMTGSYWVRWVDHIEVTGVQ